MIKRILLFVLITLLAVQLGFLAFSPVRAVEVIKDYGYLWMLVIHAWFVAAMFRCWREDGPTYLRAWLWRRRGALAFLLVAAGLLHVQERHEFKIVADELVIGNTAMRMHFDRSASIVIRAYEYAGNYTVFNEAVDKRPLAFPFLLATVHDLTGYRLENVFVLNGAISLGLVVAVWLVACRLGGAKAGVGAVILLCGAPLVAQNATGGGFELHNLFMIVLTLWLGMRYADRPRSERLAAFVLSGVILAQVRYESAFFVIPVGVTVLWVWWRERRPDFSPVVFAAPLLMLPVPLQQNVFKLTEATWQLNDVQGATSPFGFGYFYQNVGHAMNFFLSFDGSHPNSWLLALLGAVAVGFALLRIFREHRVMAKDSPSEVVAGVFIIALILHAVLMLCYFWGKWDDPIIRRLSLPTHALFVVAVVFVWGRLVRHPRAWDGLIAAAALHWVLVASPASARHPFTQENFAAATCNWVSDFIRDSVPGTAVAIDDNAGHVWFLHRKSCISPERFAISWEGYAHHFEQRSFSDFIVVQRYGVDQTTGERFLSKKDDLGDGVVLEKVAERTLAPFYIVRISRVVGVDREKLRAWAEVRLGKRQLAKEAGLNERDIWATEPVNPNMLEKWFKALP